MILEIILILLGLAVLLVGGDLLVRGAVSIASSLGIPPLLVSLTIIAFGTSAPELVVSVTSVLEHEPGIALGNIIGSNIANVFLVLGLPALIYPMSAHVQGLRRHAVAMLAATAAFAFVAYGPGALDRVSGIALFAGILAYIAFLGVMARSTHGRDPVIDEVAEYAGGEKANIGAAALYVAGALMDHLWEKAPPAIRAGKAADARALVPAVLEALKDGDIVMVKGSNASKVSEIVAAIKAAAGGQ